MTERSITKKAVGFLPHKVKENIPGNAYDFLTYNQVLFGEGQQRKIFEFSMFFCFFSSTVSTDCLLWVCLTLSYTLRVPTGNSISSSMSLCLIAFFFFSLQVVSESIQRLLVIENSIIASYGGAG